jgi:lipopolysaccharide transport system ATP-binding protein
MSEKAVVVDRLSKRYHLGARPSYETLREALVNVSRTALRRLRSGRRDRDDAHAIWALRDVSFDLETGQVLGIIGRNGAGKSTLLKILAGITRPTAGRVEAAGRIGSLLEIGTGFHPELTGHENVYLYGAILGMNRWEVSRKFDEIVAFAELERFINTPVKKYSSGMYMRLAFAVAAHLETEILLVDEVLAVGDVEFQKRCLGKMGEVTRQGRTVLFVSHNMAAIRRLCSHALLLQSGRLSVLGSVDEAIQRHEGEVVSDEAIWNNPKPPAPEDPAYLERIETLDQYGTPRSAFLSSEAILVRFTVVVNEPHSQLKIGFDAIKNTEVAFRTQHVDSPSPVAALAKGIHLLTCRIPPHLLNQGDYQLAPLVSLHCIRFLLDEGQPVLKVRVDIDASASEFHMNLNQRNQPGAVFPLLEWSVE